MDLRTALISYLKKEITIKEICEKHGGENGIPKDPKWFRKKAKDLIESGDPEIIKAYEEYKRGKYSQRERGYDYIYEILDMLLSDISQRDVAIKYKISRDTLKDAIQKDIEKYPELEHLIKEHNKRFKQGSVVQKISYDQFEQIRDEVKEIRRKYNLGNSYCKNECKTRVDDDAREK